MTFLYFKKLPSPSQQIYILYTHLKACSYKFCNNFKKSISVQGYVAKNFKRSAFQLKALTKLITFKEFKGYRKNPVSKHSVTHT